MMNYQIPFYEEGFDKIIVNSYNDEYIDDDFINTCKNKMKGFNQNNPHHNEDLLSHCEIVYKVLSEEIINYYYYQQR